MARTIIQIDPESPTPLYAQLERAIRAAIATGALERGRQLPTVRQLAVDLRVNANTVARVYHALERAGVVETRRGVGTFVAGTQPTRQSREQELVRVVERLLAEAATLGFDAADVRELLDKRITRNER